MTLGPFGGKGNLRQKITKHMGRDPAGLSIVSERLEKYNHANLHLALQDYIAKNGRSATILGIQGGFMNFTGTSLSEIASPPSMASFVGFGGAKEGPVQYTNMALADGKKIACVQGGLYLIKSDLPIVALMRLQQMDFSGTAGINLDVMAESRSAAESFMNDILASINSNNIYRGKLLSLQGQAAQPGASGYNIKFHSLPPVTREKIILPEGLLKRIERQTIDASQYGEALSKAGRRLKRGILLHGKPGTGKTLTAMYLAAAMKNRTGLIVTGRSMGMIEHSCEIARWLQPSMIIIEDVDLIAEDRSRQNECTNSILFELLNQMDGLADDADVVFLLTTNRPEILEPALASRPGRVDQAYEIPLPDTECRTRLFDLYAQGLTLDLQNKDVFIQRTAGASAAFICEMMRKAALFAAPDGDPIVVHDRHLDEALHELVVVGGNLTKTLLGFEPSDK